MDFPRLVELVRDADDAAKGYAVSAVNRALVVRNWLVGRYIVEFEQHGADRAAYGERLLKRLSAALAASSARGFSERSLELCRRFYLAIPEISQTASAKLGPRSGDSISQTLSAKLPVTTIPLSGIHQTLSEQLARHLPLTWSHYVFLVQIQDAQERRFYEIEATQQNWSLRELRRQFNSGLYERLALSRSKTNVRQLAKRGQVLAAPADAIKDPYVLEFLDLKEQPAYSESDLEQAIIDKLEHFLLELGKGFLFQARQFRLTFDDQHFWVDIVFYNRLLRCFVIVDLKLGILTHQNLGQMQMYVNYFDRHVRTKDENPTVGIVLCKTRNDAVVKMTLPKGNRTIFASRYQLYLPSKEELRAQLQAAVREHKKDWGNGKAKE